MRNSELRRTPGSPVSAAVSNPGPNLGKAGAGARNGTDGVLRSLDALEAAFGAVRERLDRLETDVRNLQSQNANRA